ncbi:hypothetical protein N7448_001548 [Penicillium atrosanguineum]|uniref:uncharacterized protein n=1 Tax=Penicillium atrosanguineum TaxID=1132637 RepID=UPI002388BE46|nr:uncharacterized protein N7443_004947 [Penicillium atrosanguineum]KAJ5133423.1 hypothetical protein N7526_004788 [Penicillium atrosanguineum]KAJ5149970.1 hypothetical protein N7448_001548 [Penicillium atrosanguineum]KAJ5305287.1 hypothetical protein N7443_004947 [Penicillium atrosanguineum]
MEARLVRTLVSQCKMEGIGQQPLGRGNTRNTGPKQGLDGPGEGMDGGIMALTPGEIFEKGIDVISARKAATDDPRLIQEHEQRF